jgi:hypothetical protein
MADQVLEKRDELLQGDSKTWSAYLPVALVEALKRASVTDGYKSTGAYVAQLLVFALRARERERLAEQLAKSAKK